MLDTAQKDSACNDLKALERTLVQLSVDNTGRQVLSSILLCPTALHAFKFCLWK